MNKHQFIEELKQKLQTLPLKEQNELLEDYESHFVYGLEQGKNEEEISQELGNPSELAADAINEYYRFVPKTIATEKDSISKKFTLLMSAIGLFLLNFALAILPLGIALWATWISLLIAVIAMGLTPIVAIVDFIYNNYFSAGVLFVCIIFSGISIYLVKGCQYIGKQLKRLTVSYYRWNLKVLKGE